MTHNRETDDVLPATIPSDAAGVVRRYLLLFDHALPGRLEGLYLIGSLALDDFKPQSSDVDLVAVTSSPLRSEELERLAALHQTLEGAVLRPRVECTYVTWRDLECNPAELGEVPFFREGHLEPAGGFDANPAVWLTLRKHPLAARGPRVPAVWYDGHETRQWLLGNLNSYWAGLLSQLQSASDAQLTAAAGGILAWCVPGVTRLHFTITTDDVTSKTGACRYALQRFPARWHPLLVDALALRASNTPTPSGLSSLDQARDGRDFMRAVIDDANALMASPES